MSGIKGAKSDKAADVPDYFQENFLNGMDGRLVVARTLRDRLKELTNDLGGLSQLSYQERSLAKRCVHLERVVERFEATLARGGTVEYGHYFGLINALSGLLSKLGLKRRPKQIQSLQEYVKEHYSRPALTEAPAHEVNGHD